MLESDFYCENVLNSKLQVKIEEETENVLAFYHTNPSWTFHIVIVPKKHIRDLISVKDLSIISEVFLIAQKIIKKYELNDSNYKIITNGGFFQDSKHLHFHLLSGESIKND